MGDIHATFPSPLRLRITDNSSCSGTERHSTLFLLFLWTESKCWHACRFLALFKTAIPYSKMAILVDGRLMYQGEQKMKRTEREHEICANFLCKLLSLPAYSHLMDLLVNDDAQKACGSWNVGQKPTEKLVRWCRDQWWRMPPVVNYDQAGEEMSSPTVTRASSCLPCCHIWGAICRDCTKDMGKDQILINICENEADEKLINDRAADDGCTSAEGIAERVKDRRNSLWPFEIYSKWSAAHVLHFNNILLTFLNW